jgi:hypothetical protein
VIKYFLAAACVALLTAIAAGYAAVRYLTHAPGTPHQGPLPPLTAEETALASALRQHVETIAAREHNEGVERVLRDAAR